MHREIIRLQLGTLLEQACVAVSFGQSLTVRRHRAVVGNVSAGVAHPIAMHHEPRPHRLVHDTGIGVVSEAAQQARGKERHWLMGCLPPFGGTKAEQSFYFL